MRSSEHLRTSIRRIDGGSYRRYRDLKGRYDLGDFALSIDHVQGDPFAAPSRLSVEVPGGVASFPPETFGSRSREIGLRDFLTRRFHDACRRRPCGRQGSGRSGLIAIDAPGQEILERTSCAVDDDGVSVRFVVGLPGFGRRVAGAHCERMLLEEIPEIVMGSLVHRSLDHAALMEHVDTTEDADHLRDGLDRLGLLAFVANGAVLPRMSGVDDRPLTGENVVPFESPDSMAVEVDLPNSGEVTGMGVGKGVTLIVGGGYHGKSTLLKALEVGVYDHIPGDGRERVVTDGRAVKIRAEDGRRIEKVDISPFIDNLPFGQDTTSFSTEDASGSTSQAANIVEALEVGATTLLIDEDTSATNFMIRDHRMQELVSKDREPITPFIDKVGLLHADHGVSTVLVIGGSGDYFDVADTVICMVEYLPQDVTDEAAGIARRYVTERETEGGRDFGNILERIPLKGSFDPSKGKRSVKIGARGVSSIAFGRHDIDLGGVEQLVDASQTRAIGNAIHHATGYMDGERTVRDVVGSVMRDIAEGGLDVLLPYPVGDLAMFRAHELAAAINRLRTVKVDKATAD